MLINRVNFNIACSFEKKYTKVMTGLRERQKNKRRESMIEAALALFRERGFDAVKLEEVSEYAEVSVGTVYSYFKTKNALLLAVIIADFEVSFAAGDAVIHGPLTDPVAAINKLSQIQFYEDEGGVTREMWRVSVAAFLRNPSSEFAIEYERCLSKMKRQIFDLVRRLQSEGFISKVIRANELASILYNNANMCFLEYLRREDDPIETLQARICRHNSRLLHWVKLVD